MATTSVVSRATPRTQSRLHLWRGKVQPLLNHLLLLTVGILFLFPFAWLVLTSLKSAREIVIFPPTILPTEVQWSNYYRAVTFMLRQFFRTIPMELSEAARIDGCSQPRIYWQIIMPLAKPALAALVMFEFMWTWSDFFGPLLYLNNQANWTLSLGLLQFKSQHETNWELLMAASTLVTLPSVFLYFFGQKAFVQGIATTGFK